MATATPAPRLVNLVGTGIMLVGTRDRDDATGTVVKTRAFTFLFVPLVALDAHRVFETTDGECYFREPVPLSPFARAWNRLFALLVVVALGVGAWLAVTRNANYQAAQLLARADRLAADGQGKDAAEIYRDIMLGPSKKPAVTARERFDALVIDPPGDLADTADILRIAVALQMDQQHTVPDLFDHAVTLARQHDDKDPAGALAILEAVTPLAPKPAEHLQARRKLLDRLVDKSPDDVDFCARLAMVCVEQGDLKRCQAVLARHEDKLGDRDAAAVLGRIYALQGKLDKAEKLLAGYFERRLAEFRAAEQAFQSAFDRVHQDVVEAIQQKKADGFDFAVFHTSSQADQNQMFLAYRERRLREDADVRAALERRARQAWVVQAAVDLGDVLLLRAGALPDASARDKALARAEEAFLAVEAFAHNSDKYRLSLAKVFYSRGKQEQGRKLLDQFLQQHKRRSDTMLVAAELLREVGASSEARALLEEAYARESNAKAKQLLAASRAVMHLDLDDQILWLGRADPAAPAIQALLTESKAARAVRDGKDAEATRLYKEALTIHARMPQTIGTLNNSALAHFNLYQLTQDPEQFRQGAAKLDLAAALRPGDSLLVGNAASMLLQGVARDLIGNALDFKALKRTPGLDLLPYLYHDAAGRKAMRKRLQAQPALAKAKGYFEKLIVLAPGRVAPYASLAMIYDELDDVEGLRRLTKAAESARLDLDDSRRQTLERYAGKKDEQDRDDLKKSMPRLEEALAAARKVGGPTLAVAFSRVASTRVALARYEVPTDADAILKLAQDADAAAPSASTRSLRIEAHQFRAHQALMQDKGYAELAQKTRRSLGPQLINWVVGQPGKLRELALTNADVQAALRLTAEQAKAFPDEAGVGAWAILRAAHPEVAETIAVRLKENPRQPLLRALDRRLSPLNAVVTVNSYWWLVLSGKQGEADQLLREQAKRGVPLP